MSQRNWNVWEVFAPVEELPEGGSYSPWIGDVFVTKDSIQDYDGAKVEALAQAHKVYGEKNVGYVLRKPSYR